MNIIDLTHLSNDFEKDIRDYCDALQSKTSASLLLLESRQLADASIIRANNTDNPVDFYSRLKLALSENYKTEFYLELVLRSGHLSANSYTELSHKCNLVRRILIKSMGSHAFSTFTSLSHF